MKRQIVLPFVVLGLISAASSCSTESSAASVASPVSEGPASSPGGAGGATSAVAVTAQEVADLMNRQGGSLVVIDVRTAEEYAEGHIVGAMNLDVEGGQFTVGLAALDPAKEYVVYCRSGRRSAIAAQAMIDAGFVTVYDLGPLDAWAAAGFPVVVD